MKKALWFALALCCLTGCSHPAWETVEDPAEAVSSVHWIDEAYRVEISLPEGIEPVFEEKAQTLYSSQHGDFEIQTRTYLASSPDEAIQSLTGYEAQALTVLQTQRSGMPEYRFAWIAQGEQGSRVCRADLVMNGTECYAVVCSTNEDAGNAYQDQMRYVFSTFGLSADEGV